MSNQDATDLHAFYKRMEQLNLDEAKRAGIGDDITRLIANSRAKAWGLAAKQLAKYITLPEPQYEQALCVGSLR